MINKEKIEEIEYYTYLESIIENLDINIDKINAVEKENKKLKIKVIIIYVFIVLLIIANLCLAYLVLK